MDLVSGGPVGKTQWARWYVPIVRWGGKGGVGRLEKYLA